MDNNLIERMRFLLKYRHTNPQKIADAIGVSSGAIKNLLYPDRKQGDASPLLLKGIAEFCDVNIEWLMNGTGEMDIKQSMPEENRQEEMPQLYPAEYEYDLSDADKEFLNVYLSLSNEDRKTISEFILKLHNNSKTSK